jgi:hypothetical protein
MDYTNPVWLKSAKGREWLSTASIAELCAYQWQLVLRRTGLPEDEEAYDMIEHAIRGDEPA